MSGFYGVYNTQRVVQRDLAVNSCGCQVVNDRDYAVRRTRTDYTVMFLSQGQATVYIEDSPHTLHAGEALLYLPGTVQHHLYRLEDGCVNKFVHFSGRLCSVLDGDPIRLIHVVSRNEFESNFDRLIRAYCRVDDRRELLCDGYLRTLLALLGDSDQPDDRHETPLQERVRYVINLMHTHLNEPIDFDRCAQKCYVSRARFNHLFKEQTGYPPLQYLNKIRMDRATQLLTDSGLSVSECAETLGFADVNYFCRLFRKAMGVSPSVYRKSGKP